MLNLGGVASAPQRLPVTLFRTIVSGRLLPYALLKAAKTAIKQPIIPGKWCVLVGRLLAAAQSEPVTVERYAL